jgi:hypothetical protein
MNAAIDVDELKSLVRKEIRNKFADLILTVRKNRGSIVSVAAQIGAKRQMLDQYAKGSVPQADVLLAAFLKWDWSIKIDNPTTEGPRWFEFALSDMDGGLRKRRPDPVQMSLFEALNDMEEKIETLKKSVGRVEFEVQRAFGKTA